MKGRNLDTEAELLAVLNLECLSILFRSFLFHPTVAFVIQVYFIYLVHNAAKVGNNLLLCDLVLLFSFFDGLQSC